MSIKTMKQEILSMSKNYGLDTGHIFPPKMITSKLIKLNPQDKEDFINAFDELVSEGTFEDKDTGLFLTEEGRKVLY